MAFAMAATYDPDPTQFLGVRLPVTLDTCELIADRWANWLRWDPVNIVEERGVADRLKRMKALYIDCGDVDQYNLVYGARRVRRRMEALGVPHRVDFEGDQFFDRRKSVAKEELRSFFRAEQITQHREPSSLDPFEQDRGGLRLVSAALDFGGFEVRIDFLGQTD